MGGVDCPLEALGSVSILFQVGLRSDEMAALHLI